MLQIGEKVFMNIQEAVGWLLKNNALPFQSTANYVADTEIAKTSIINPSPAEIKVGSLVLFADSKIGTVSGITSNGFMVGSDYTNIKNALAYIVSVALNASNHLITTLSDGTTKDAGLIREVSSMSINASQHLIVNYNDGTTNDLGAIFNGSITISGNLTVTGGISGNVITGDSIIENMSGYSFNNLGGTANVVAYAGAVKTGNKLTFVLAGKLTPTESAFYSMQLGQFSFPADIGTKMFPINANNDIARIQAYFGTGTYTGVTVNGSWFKDGSTSIKIRISGANLVAGTEYDYRLELTVLLSDSLN